MQNHAITFILATLAGSLASRGGVPAQPRGWQPVQPGQADVSPLSWSLQYVQPTLQSPGGFDRVFRLQSPSDLYGRAATEGGLFARVSGGITAVFPVSQYVQTAQGERPVIPAGTIFILGDPAKLLATPPPTPPAFQLGNATTYAGGTPSTRVPRRQNLRADTSSPPSPAPPFFPARGHVALAPNPPSLWENEPYRRERVARLLSEIRAPR